MPELDLDTLPFIEAANHGGRRPMPPSMVVIHTAETPETDTAAEGVANYFHGGGGSTQLSIDNNSAVRCVWDEDVCWGAGDADANRVGLHSEHAGYAGQDDADWLDPYSRATLVTSASLTRQWVQRYPNIRVERITADRLRTGERNGICGHNDYNEAYSPNNRSRTDPGEGFPWAMYLQMVGNQPTQIDYDNLARLLAELEGDDGMKAWIDGGGDMCLLTVGKDSKCYFKRCHGGTWMNPPAVVTSNANAAFPDIAMVPTVYGRLFYYRGPDNSDGSPRFVQSQEGGAGYGIPDARFV